MTETLHYDYDARFTSVLAKVHKLLPALPGYDAGEVEPLTCIEFHPNDGKPFMAWFIDEEKESSIFTIHQSGIGKRSSMLRHAAG